MFRKFGILSALITLFLPIFGQNFIEVKDLNFFHQEEVYNFIGTNYWYGLYLGATEEGQERLLNELDQLQARGVNNLRIMAAFEGTETDKWRVAPGIQTAPYIYDEELLKGLDFLLEEMGKRDMKAVLVLNNFWLWSGGMAQYVNWVDGSDIPTPTPFDGTAYQAYTKYTASFYSNPKAVRIFNAYVEHLIGRENTINGKSYIDDPVIMSWQLANEPRGMNNVNAYKNWLKETAALIKSLDPNHLVSIGSEGNTSTPLPNGLDFYNDHDLKDIDYCTFHLWVKNWSWFDPLNAEKTYPKAIKEAKRYIKKHNKQAVKLNKPLVLEEFGISRDLNDHNWEANTNYRDKYFAFIFDSCLKSVEKQKALVGCNFWAYGGSGRPSSPKSVWYPGDDLIGDPPHEFQGWYSVYDIDKSTLDLIQAYSRRIKQSVK